MTDIPPTSQLMVTQVRAQNRRRNMALLALAAVVAGLAVYFMVLTYGASVDSHSASQQTVGLQNQNHDLLLQLNADDAIIKADDALIKAATSPVAQAANAQATKNAIAQLVRCIDNHVDVVAGLAAPLADCPPVPAPTTPAPGATSPTTTTTVPRPVAVAPRPVPAPSARAAPSGGCSIRVGQVCLNSSTVTTAGPGVGCGAAVAYLAAHAAPGFDFTCGPGATAAFGCPPPPPGLLRVGCTTAIGNPNGPVTGHIYIESSCAMFTAYANEASNSRVLAGLSNAPLDPYGKSRCPA